MITKIDPMKHTAKQKCSELAVVIAPFPGKLQLLASTAAAQLAKEGFCKLLDVNTVGHHHSTSYDLLLIEDGYTADLYQELFTKHELTVAHHLVLRDLGLDETAEIDEDNIDLVKDAIEAESIVIDSYTPQFNCPCCG